MFDVQELTEIEKKIILKIGDNVNVPTFHDPFFKMKIRKEIYEKYFSDEISFEEFNQVMKGLFYKGLTTFVPASITILNNISDKEDTKKRFDKSYELEEGWEYQGVVRLTQGNERTVPGEDVYNYLIQENLNEQYKNLNEKLKENQKVVKRIERFEKKLDNINNQYLGSMGIFIAIFTLIIGNSSIIPLIKNLDFSAKVFMLLATNGTILFCICFLLLLTRIFFMNMRFKWSHFLFFLIPVLLIVTAFLSQYIHI